MLTLNEHGEFVSNSNFLTEARKLNEASSPEDFVIKDGVLKKYVGPGGDVVIPDEVTSIGGSAFSKCTSLTSITIPDSVTSIGDSAFFSCTSLKSVIIGDNVISIGKIAFYGCDSLTNVYITDLEAWCGIDFYSYDSNPLYYAKNLYVNGELATDIVIPDGIISIGWGTFYNCKSLTSVTIPNSVTSIGGSAFSGCSNLTSIAIPNNVTSIGDYAFSKCSSLTNVTLPEGLISVENGVFRDCKSLTNIVIPNSVKKIDSYAFLNISDNLTIICAKNSAADKFAKKNEITVEYNGEVKRQLKSSGESQIITISAEGEREVQTGDIDIQHIADEFLDQDKIDNKFKKDLQDILSKKFKNTTVVEFDSGELYVDDPEAEIKIKTPYSVDEILDALSDEELYGTFEIVVPGDHKELDYYEYDEDEEIYVDVDFKYSNFSEYLE